MTVSAPTHVLDEYLMTQIVSRLSCQDAENLQEAKFSAENTPWFPMALVKKVVATKLRPTKVFLIHQEGIEESWMGASSFHYPLGFSTSIEALQCAIGKLFPSEHSADGYLDQTVSQECFSELSEGRNFYHYNGSEHWGRRGHNCTTMWTRGTILHLILDNPDCQTLYMVMRTRNLDPSDERNWQIGACLETPEAITRKFPFLDVRHGGEHNGCAYTILKFSRV